jgi:DNA helicase HerA-like ATPase
LRELIVDTYKSKGIYEDDMNTWDKEVPIMEDLGKLVDYIRKVLNAEVHSYAGVLQESIKNIKNYMPKESFEKTKESIEKIEEVVNDINIENEKQLYGNINLGYYLHPSVKRVFEGLYVYLEDIVKMTIFNGEKPKITKGVNRLDFSAFTQVNKPLIAKFLAEFTAQKLFRASMIRGQYSELSGVLEGTKFDRVLVFDESKLALPNGAEKNNSFNIFNRLCSESRKYGLALFLASQRVEHYSEEILSNIFTKIILKVKANDYKSVARALGLKEDFVADTFSITKERPAIIDTNGSKHSYIIEKL